MKVNLKLGQGLAWAAWLLFIASLILPMETHTLAGPCDWPCAQPFTYYGWQNASFFFMNIIAFGLSFVQAISVAIFDPPILRRILESLFSMGIYAVIGLGQFGIALAPIWPIRIKKTVWLRVHLWVLMLSTVSAIAYGLFPDLRLGLELLHGYYPWVFSFILMCAASIWQTRKRMDSQVEERQLSSSQAL